MRNPLRYYRDWRADRQAKRREQRTKERLILGAYDSGRELARVMAELTFLGLDKEHLHLLEGTELRCMFCGKSYKHNGKTCRPLGFCPRCSKP